MWVVGQVGSRPGGGWWVTCAVGHMGEVTCAGTGRVRCWGPQRAHLDAGERNETPPQHKLPESSAPAARALKAVRSRAAFPRSLRPLLRTRPPQCGHVLPSRGH
eukprot:1369072-Prymnesium_polylepis.1